MYGYNIFNIILVLENRVRNQELRIKAIAIQRYILALYSWFLILIFSSQRPRLNLLNHCGIKQRRSITQITGITLGNLS